MAGNTGFNIPPRIDTGPRKALYSGVVTGEERFGSYNRLYINLDNAYINGVTVPVHLPVRVYGPRMRSCLGAQISIHGKIHHSVRNTDLPVLTGKVTQIQDSSQLLWKFVQDVRKYIECVFNDLFTHHRHDLASGLITGGSGHLKPTMKNVFTRAGILHILAVSGLHIGFVCLFGYALFSVTFLPRALKFIGVMFLVVCYVFVTSFRPSVCRAAFMAALFGIALLQQRNVDRIHITNIAAITLLFVDPILLFSLSAQLSFVAVYGIILLYPKLYSIIKKNVTWKPLRVTCSLLAVSCSAQIFVTPLIIHYFRRISIIAPVSNLLIVPLTTCIVFMLYICLVLHHIWCGGTQTIALFVRPLFDLLLFIARSTSSIPFSVIRVSIPVSVLMCTWGFFIVRIRRYMIYIVILLLGLFGIASLSKRMVIMTYKDTMIIECPDRKKICFSFDPVDGSELAQIMNVCSKPYVTYAIAPHVVHGISGQWIPSPDFFTTLRMEYGDIEIMVDSTVVVKYGCNRFVWNGEDATKARDCEIMYLLSNKKKNMCFKRAVSGSIFDDLFTELRIIGGQCLLCF